MDAHEHEVAVYDTVALLADRVADYVAQGLAAGEHVLTVSRPEHRQAVDDLLADRGVDALRARRHGGLVTLDAEQTMARFFVDGAPDPDLFAALVSGLVSGLASDAAPRHGPHVRIYGEMVALLWESGDVVAALELEALWNGVLPTLPATLLCAYATHPLTQGALADVARMCDLHDHTGVIGGYTPPSSGGGALAASSGVQLPVPEAVPAARRFVVDVVDSWGLRAITGDAALVTSELVTNAVVHGGSPFVASVTRLGRAVRVAVEDAAASWPQRQHAQPGDQDGRGMAIVEALATRVGCDRTRSGKVAWAELSA